MKEVVALHIENRPNEVPTSLWIEKNKKYTVIDVVKCNAQGGILGFKLEEIDLSPCAPYLYFAAWRFGIPIPEKELEEVEELAI